MKAFRQLVPMNAAQVSVQIQAILTIDALETNPARREQIDFRVIILEGYMHYYNDFLNTEYSFVRDQHDNSLCLTCKN